MQIKEEEEEEEENIDLNDLSTGLYKRYTVFASNLSYSGWCYVLLYNWIRKVCVKSILCLFLRFFTHLLYDCVGRCSSFFFFFFFCRIVCCCWGGGGVAVAAGVFLGGYRGEGGVGGGLFVFPAIGHGMVADGLVFLSGSVVIGFPMQLGSGVNRIWPVVGFPMCYLMLRLSL